MLRLIACLLAFGLVPHFVSPQVVIQMSDFAGFLREQNLRETVYNPREKSSFAGSPYLRDSFQRGVVLTRKQVNYTGIPLRYNIYLDELEFTDEKGRIWALANPGTVDYVEIGEDKLVYRPFQFMGRMKQGFFLALVEGKVSLLHKPGIRLEKPKAAGAYKDAQPARFVKQPDEYYLQEENQPARYISSRKHLLELFPDRRDELSAFIKTHQVKINKPESLVKLARFYNEAPDTRQ